MTTTSQEIERIDPKDSEQLTKASAWLQRELGYSRFECRKALFGSDGDIAKAAESLAAGGWMFGKLISWNWESLSAKSAELSAKLGLPETWCLDVLKKCNGNVELAQRKIACLPALQRLPVSLDEPAA
jgi:hypothetical protein